MSPAFANWRSRIGRIGQRVIARIDAVRSRIADRAARRVAVDAAGRQLLCGRDVGPRERLVAVERRRVIAAGAGQLAREHVGLHQRDAGAEAGERGGAGGRVADERHPPPRPRGSRTCATAVKAKSAAVRIASSNIGAFQPTPVNARLSSARWPWASRGSAARGSTRRPSPALAASGVRPGRSDATRPPGALCMRYQPSRSLGGALNHAIAQPSGCRPASAPNTSRRTASTARRPRRPARTGAAVRSRT